MFNVKKKRNKKEANTGGCYATVFKRKVEKEDVYSNLIYIVHGDRPFLTKINSE